MDRPLIKEIESKGFENVLSMYQQAMEIKASTKKKEEDQKELLKLDKWIQEDLPKQVAKEEEPHITHEDLVNLMKWKLLRGKWRPKLMQLAKSNKPHIVVDISRKAIRLAQQLNIEGAMKNLCTLTGVGPATASAILSVCAPETFAFFADEVAQVFLDGKLNYNLSEYLTFINCITEVNEYLKKKKEIHWTPHLIEKTIWTYCIIKEHSPDSLSRTDSVTKPPSKKIKKC